MSLKALWKILLQPADECGLFPIVTRIGIYGFLLSFILYTQATRFDAGELLTVVSFISIVTVMETMWKKTNAGKQLLWHLCSLIVLVGFLGFLVNQAEQVREAWFRTHVLEERIQDLIAQSPTAIIVSDGIGNIKYINQHTTDLIGWKNDEISGKPLTTLMRPHKVAAHKAAFNKESRELKTGSAHWVYTGNKIFRVVAKNGVLIKVQIYIFGVRYSTELEKGRYPLGQDVEFYAILDPVATLIEPEEAELDATLKLDAARKEERADKIEEKVSKE